MRNGFFIVMLLFCWPGWTCAEENVLADAGFARGLYVKGVKHEEPGRTVRFTPPGVTDKDEKTPPAWEIAQWHSRGCLDKTEITPERVTLSDAYKSVTLDRHSGAVTLTAEASREYEKPRVSAGEPWVHLLLEQGHFSQPVKCADVTAIIVEAELELMHLEAAGVQNPALHAAQFSWFLYLKNMEKDSPGRHDFLWFGLSFFDSRHDFTPDYAAQDFAVPDGKFIYTVGSRHLLAEKIAKNRRFTICRDILPDIRRAVETAHEKGFIPYTAVEDLTLDGMNIGWEITGKMDAGMRIHRIKLEIRNK